MTQELLRSQRQSGRLSISIPLILSGVDAEGISFRESVRTLIVNQHGGKISTSRRLKLGAEVSIENPALGVVAKAKVAWLSPRHFEEETHQVGLQLLQAQNIWGVEFTADDWQPGPRAENTPAQPPPPEAGTDHATPAGKSGFSPAGEKASVAPVLELEEFADAQAREFQQRLKQLTQQLSSEFESNLREQAARAQEREAGAWKDEITALKQKLDAAEEEVAKLEARVQQLQSDLREAGKASAAFLADAQHQLAALSKSILVSMNRATESGLAEYHKLLKETNQESAVRRRTGAEPNSPPPKA